MELTEREKRTYKNDDMWFNLGKNLYTIRTSGKYCDFEFKSEDGHKIKAHKVVLEVVSKVFKALFNSESEWADSKNEDITVKNITGENLEKIIEYMYTGKIEITGNNVRNILDGSSFLGLDNLVEFCLSYLSEMVNDENCFDLWDYAESYAHLGDELKNACILQIMRNAEKVLKTEEFVEKVCFNKLKTLISYDEKERCEEKILLSGIMDWLNHDFETRKCFINDLLKEIRFEYITNELFLSIMDEESPLFKSEAFMEKIVEIFKENVKTQIDHGYGKKSIKIFKEEKSITNHFNIIENMYSVVGNQLMQYNKSRNKFIKTITEMPEHGNYTCTLLKHKNLFTYSYDSDSGLSDVSYYSFQTKDWLNLPNLSNVLTWCRSASIDDKVYLSGLELFDHEYSLKVFDMPTELWSDVSFDYALSLSEYGLCNLDNCLFIMEGLNNYQFDLRTNIGIKLEECTNSIESIRGYNNCIYGFSDEGINIFDIRAQKWMESIKPYTVNYSGAPYSCIQGENIGLLGHIEFKIYTLQILNVASDINSSENIVVFFKEPPSNIIFL